MPEDVLRQLAQVLRDRVPPAAEERERARREREVDRSARADAVLDVRCELGESDRVERTRRGGEPLRVADERRVDVDLANGELQRGELLEREHLVDVD